METGSLEGKGFVVTGGTHGVGPAVVLMAAQRGAVVLFCGPPDSEKEGDKVISAASDVGAADRVNYLAADLSREEEVDRLFDEAFERLPGCHVLINNIGKPAILTDKRLHETPLDDWNKVLAANVREPFWLSRRAVEEFLGGGEGGRIVHLVSAVTGGPTAGASYAASQTALYGLIRSIAKEVGRRGIACNGIVIGTRPEGVTKGAAIPQRQPEAIAEAVLFLAGNEASYINGEVLYL